MSASVPYRPIPATLPTRIASAATSAATRAPWGWLELIAISPNLFPALTFIPGIFPIRTYLRVASFAIVLAAWFFVVVVGKGARPIRPYLPAQWLMCCTILIAVSIFHPTTNSLVSGIAGALLDIAILCPVFWVTQVTISPERMGRIIKLIFLANALSALWGIGQFYYPERFNPPDIMAFKTGVMDEGALSYETADGRKIVRPCGLTDMPGGAAGGGMVTCLVGLIWILRPMRWWQRVFLFGLSFMGMGVVFMAQVRQALITLIATLLVTIGLLIFQRNFRRATALAVMLGVVAAGSVAWAVRAGGDGVMRRFLALLDEDAATTYHKNRGGFLQDTLENKMWEYPFGAGLGRWGMINYNFGDRSQAIGTARGPLWSEIQLTAWIYDGGILLAIGYIGAILLAVWAVFSVVRSSPSPDLAFWACPIFAICLNVIALTMGSMPFISPIGIQFWVLAASLYTADQQARSAASRQIRTKVLATSQTS